MKPEKLSPELHATPEQPEIKSAAEQSKRTGAAEQTEVKPAAKQPANTSPAEQSALNAAEQPEGTSIPEQYETKPAIDSVKKADLSEQPTKNSRSRRIYLLILLFVITLSIVAAWQLRKIQKTELTNTRGHSFEKAVVTEVLRDNVQADGSRVGEQRVRVRLSSGSHKGEEIETSSPSGYLFGAPCVKGMKVIIMQSVTGDTLVTSVYAQDRGNVILIFALLYLLVLCWIGGKQGLRGALGLIYTVAAIFFLFIPLVYLGYSPFWMAVLVCLLTTFVSMTLIGGFSRKTLAATLGTSAGVIIAGLVAMAFSFFSGISGWNVSNIEHLMTLWYTENIRVGDLLFAGLLISALGAVMDVAMSISSTMQEILQQRPDLRRSELIKAGFRVGRDMMGTDSNTLILAFAGGSVSVLLLNYAYQLPLLQILNSNNIGIAVMQGLAGSFGVALSVPATVLLAALIYLPPGKNPSPRLSCGAR